MLNRLEIKGKVNNSSNALASNSREEYPKIIYHNGKPYVDARTLHKFLESKQWFLDWFKARVRDWDFMEEIDFFATFFYVAKRGGHNRKDYLITLDMAKELGMLERTKKGKEIRLYYISLEKRLHDQHISLHNCYVQEIEGKRYYSFWAVMRTLNYKSYGLSQRKVHYPAHFLYQPSGWFITEEYAAMLAFSRGLISKRTQLKSCQLTLQLN